MRHLDLFSGIGGFAYAAQQVWGDEYECVRFCETDQFCRQVLTKNFPGVPIHGDIRTLVNDSGGVDLVTGGFPCQPFSSAGRRRGTDDDRYLWPEMLRVIREYQPQWVIAENVLGLTTWNEGLVLETVCSDLEGAGYEVQPLIIPAVAVNAPHRRDRTWIIAYAGYGHGAARPSRSTQEPERSPADSGRQDWQRNWREVAVATCHGGVDDGLSGRLVRLSDGSTITSAHWREQALKAYGNAIVPQVAMQIMNAFKSLAPPQ